MIKADFYQPTITKGDYQEDILSWAHQFSSGVRTKTVTFKDKLAAQQSVSDVSLLVYCRKNPNTMAIESNWQVELAGDRYEVNGIDANPSNLSEIVLYCERVTQ